MGLIDILNHLVNFTAPAFAVALVTAFFASRLLSSKDGMPGFRVLAGSGFCVGMVVSLAGLWLFGRDGRMATYAAMVVACATVPWVLARGWKT